MEDQLRELARRDAKAIRGGMAAVGVAILAGVLGLFTPALVGILALAVGILVLLNSLVAWSAGPQLMYERRLVLAPAVIAGIPMALGAYAAFGGTAAIVASLPAAAVVTIVIGMTLAGRRA
jgi:hypothetical protein